ncbi:MAG: IS1 family transposase [Moorea sp. SIO2I5]|nr:IS1 family transposase [Moorena sp. SIO2I5]
MTRIESENTRLRHYLARLHRRTLCYSKSSEAMQQGNRGFPPLAIASRQCWNYQLGFLCII